MEKATLAGGCFWCLDTIYRQTRGVSSVVSGYSGGHVTNPTYLQMHEEDTGHAEAVQIQFDPDVIPYRTILEIFWASHNPTTLNQDGANVGAEYRSEIFYHNEEQKQVAEKTKTEYAAKLWDNPIVTKITPFSNFYPAEDYHQDYYTKNPQAGYCQVIINPKLEKFRHKFEKWLI